ncbi:hypothetical protein GCM10022295_27550 [Streptomyces osmaniensis]|uniref:Uncharacterized protein n=1 Tax=Streptomyces osmaniensis TaxID=593134 RepID=A0ABP6W4L2_9ACTN
MSVGGRACDGLRRQPAAPLADSHPVPGPPRALIDAIVLAVRTGDDPGIRVLRTQLAPLADTTALLLLRYRSSHRPRAARQEGGSPRRPSTAHARRRFRKQHAVTDAWA